jgi:hypothetical protein
LDDWLLTSFSTLVVPWLGQSFSSTSGTGNPSSYTENIIIIIIITSWVLPQGLIIPKDKEGNRRRGSIETP